MKQIFTLFFLVFLSFSPFLLRGSTCTWTGAAGDNNWNNNANWSCGAVPTTVDDVVISNVTVTAPTATVQSLSLNNATLTITSSSIFTVSMNVNIQNSNIVGGSLSFNNLTVPVGSNLNLTDASLHSSDMATIATLTNNGTLVLNGSLLYGADVTIINNGLLDVPENASIYNGTTPSFTVVSTINNTATGEIRITKGYTFAPTICGSGLINVLSTATLDYFQMDLRFCEGITPTFTMAANAKVRCFATSFGGTISIGTGAELYISGSGDCTATITGAGNATFDGNINFKAV